jgi:hypothetical protein
MRTRKAWLLASVIPFVLAGVLPLRAQETAQAPEQSAGGWRKFGDPAPSGQAPSNQPAPAGALTLPAGTWITVRVDQELSSDHNQAGDAFTATLAQPVVADGLVVAGRGQTVGGRVVEAEKAGRAKGTSRLGVALTELSLVDGRQVPIKTSLMEYQAGKSVGRDAGAVATTTGVGAAIGAAADGGFGAGMGAIAGAAAGMIGVLSTRGRPTVIYPEAQLTFRLEQPLTISTETSADVFRPVNASDYEQKTLRREGRAQAPPPPPPSYYPGYYYGPWYYPGYYSPYYWGPGLYFGIYSGPRFYGHRGFGRRW